MTKLMVDLWSDLICPWCAIGLTGFLAARQQLSGEVEIDLVAMPFQLSPDIPLAGRAEEAHLAGIYRRSPEEMAAMRARVVEAGEKGGFSLQWQGEGAEPVRMVWNTAEAHRLLRWALAAHGPEAQIGLKQALFRAHFQQRLAIGQREVLLAIAAGEGLDAKAAAQALDDPALAEAVKWEERRGRAAGIDSVPSFVVNGRYVLQGAQDVAGYMRALRQIASMEAAA